MKYSFHPSAKKELFKAVEFYEDCSTGLGLEFSKEIFSTIQHIIEFPHSWSKLSKNTRRCLTKRFPYGVIYEVTEDDIFIIAIMQLKRKPGYWKKRKR